MGDILSMMSIFLVVMICLFIIIYIVPEYKLMSTKEKKDFWKFLTSVITKALAILFAVVCKTLAVLLAFLHKPQDSVKTTNSTRSSSDDVAKTTQLHNDMQIKTITKLREEYKLAYKTNENMRFIVPEAEECKYASSYADNLTTKIESMGHQGVCVELQKAIQWLECDTTYIAYLPDIK